MKLYFHIIYARSDVKQKTDCTLNHWRSASLHVISTFSHIFTCDYLFSTWGIYIRHVNFVDDWLFHTLIRISTQVSGYIFNVFIFSTALSSLFSELSVWFRLELWKAGGLLEALTSPLLRMFLFIRLHLSLQNRCQTHHTPSSSVYKCSKTIVFRLLI